MSANGPGLRFVLNPIAERLTTCAFSIAVDEMTVWPAFGADDVRLDIQLDDLLSHLAEFWKPLMLRQVYPIEVNPSRPSQLRQAAEERWAGYPETTVLAEEDAVADFEEAHDLTHAFAGYFELPSFWLLRAGDQFIIDTNQRLWTMPYEAVHATLVALGDEICERLAGANTKRWDALIASWRARDSSDGIGLLAWSAGLSRSLAKTLIDEGVLRAPRNFEDVARDDDELRIAARMAGALSPAQMRDIIALAKNLPGRKSETLTALATGCADYIAKAHGRERPFRQGEAAAIFARGQLGVSASLRVDIFGIAASLGVEVRHARSDPSTLDGLAIWGPRHGPGVFLNEASGRIVRPGEPITESGGARVTLAHELCHLLLDGRHALSAIEILKARMPAGVEQRAKSFAGEFLLPTGLAEAQWNRAGRPRDQTGVNAVLEALITAFGVTRSVAAWKLEHAARLHDCDLRPILDGLAPRR